MPLHTQPCQTDNGDIATTAGESNSNDDITSEDVPMRRVMDIKKRINTFIDEFLDSLSSGLRLLCEYKRGYATLPVEDIVENIKNTFERLRPPWFVY